MGMRMIDVQIKNTIHGDISQICKDEASEKCMPTNETTL